MKFIPKDDGITHINIYSKAQTPLGIFLSNFTYHPIETKHGPFNSIEGYWYWLMCRDDRLRKLHGYEAKKLGRKLCRSDWIRPHQKKDIKLAIYEKIITSEKFYSRFMNCELPFTHYYVTYGKVTRVPQADWLVDWFEKLREILRG